MLCNITIFSFNIVENSKLIFKINANALFIANQKNENAFAKSMKMHFQNPQFFFGFAILQIHFQNPKLKMHFFPGNKIIKKIHFPKLLHFYMHFL